MRTEALDRPLVLPYIDPGIDEVEPELEPTVSGISVEWDPDPLVSLKVIV